MSKVTSPILLDSTGQDINLTLQGIQEALMAANTLIDDTTTAANRVWSSDKIVKALTVEDTVTGTSSVNFEAIAATPLTIKTAVVDAPINVSLIMSSTNGNNRQWDYLVPVNGVYNWSTGALIMPDGTEVQLVAHSIKAFGGTSTLSVENATSIEVKYRTISKSTGGSCDCSWDIISGGTAKEEA